MPEKKTAETKAAETAAPVEEKKTAAAKKPAEKKATAAKKPAEKKAAAAKKPAEKKATAAKKPAEKKATAAKKTAAAAVDSKVVIQAMGSEVNTAELISKATKASGVKTVKKVDVYIRPEVNKVYYVVNGDVLGDFDLF